MERSFEINKEQDTCEYIYKFPKTDNFDIKDAIYAVLNDIKDTVKKYTRDVFFKKFSADDNGVMKFKLFTGLDKWLEDPRNTYEYLNDEYITVAYDLVGIPEAFKAMEGIKSYVNLMDSIPISHNNSVVHIIITEDNIIFIWDGIHRRIRFGWMLLDFSEQVSEIGNTKVTVDPYKMAIPLD